jgi:hypothetical protein
MFVPVALYGCETWYVTPRGEHSLMVHERRALGRIFGPKREELV